MNKIDIEKNKRILILLFLGGQERRYGFVDFLAFLVSQGPDYFAVDNEFSESSFGSNVLWILILVKHSVCNIDRSIVD